MNANLIWPSLEEIQEMVRKELQQALHPEGTENSKRLHDLEHCLHSFLDFVNNPKIAGETWVSIHLYEASLCEQARKLLEDE